MLYQIHQQSKTDRTATEMIIQGEAKTQQDIKNLLQEAIKEEELPDDMDWLIVPEGSDNFIMTFEEGLQ